MLLPSLPVSVFEQYSFYNVELEFFLYLIIFLILTLFYICTFISIKIIIVLNCGLCALSLFSLSSCSLSVMVDWIHLRHVYSWNTLNNLCAQEPRAVIFLHTFVLVFSIFDIFQLSIMMDILSNINVKMIT